eukprot:CAMPEP_0115524434 /NCGR_PEP_ID=MMETSP0271-20121206/81183_1 /TAXON_ID=71861 /ORGANISM="Scrippsiella trochoidea, Strain CCMP3099" /LENGTH=30 /DNA_ID= /DNA_START= /DNA_END= /DNA_ORIENTATION=
MAGMLQGNAAAFAVPVANRAPVGPQPQQLA